MITVPLKAIILDFENRLKNEGYVLECDKTEVFFQHHAFHTFDDAVNTLEHYIHFLLLKYDRVILYVKDSYLAFLNKFISVLIRKGYDIYTHGSPKTLVGAIELGKEYDLIPSSFYKRIEKYEGILLIADVHAVKEKLKVTINIAERRNLYMIFLGDIVDHGDNSVYAVETLYHLLSHGKCELVLGNHDKRILTWINGQRHGYKVALNDSNQTSIREIRQLNHVERMRFFNIYKLMVSMARTHLFFDNIRIVHAAYSVEMENYGHERYFPNQLARFALAGEFDVRYMRHNHEWIERIPKNVTVFVGHETVDEPKKLIVNSRGGRCYMIDMGCGKNGFLQLCHLTRNRGVWEPVAWTLL